MCQARTSKHIRSFRLARDRLRTESDVRLAGRASRSDWWRATCAGIGDRTPWPAARRLARIVERSVSEPRWARERPAMAEVFTLGADLSVKKCQCRYIQTLCPFLDNFEI